MEIKKLVILIFLFCDLTAWSQSRDSVFIDRGNYSRIDTIYYNETRIVKIVNCFENGSVTTSLHFDSTGTLDEISWFNVNHYKMKSLTWYSNGKVKSNLIYSNGALTSGISWYENGAIKSVTKTHSDSTITSTYFGSGRLQSLIIYKHEVPIYSIYYCENGTVVSEVKMGTDYKYIERFCDSSLSVVAYMNRDGYLIGNYRKYHSNGRLAISGQFKTTIEEGDILTASHGGLGVKCGKWKYYNYEGKKTDTVLYQNGSIH